MTTPALSETHDELARRLGVTRNKRIVVPCSGCGVGCYAVEPLGCFCVKCVAKQRETHRVGTAEGSGNG